MERDELLKTLTELDFMATDLALYLNTHPTNKEAIEQYNKIIKAADTVRLKYEKSSGPVCSWRSLNRCEDIWQWDDNPWPWQNCFNYEMRCK
ncbi:spore coat protein CotJB [Anaerotignum faecicola]|nr:spore coat protein CotJB [Anaerotignum faecicola]